LRVSKQNRTGGSHEQTNWSSLCLCGDMMKVFHHDKDPQYQVTDAEVITTGIVAALHNGQPVEFFLAPGDQGDASAYSLNDFNLPDNARDTGDKVYTDYDILDTLIETGIRMTPIHKNNSKCLIPHWVYYLQSIYRKIIEIACSLIECSLPKSIYSATSQGFELKVHLFVPVFSLNLLW